MINSQPERGQRFTQRLVRKLTQRRPPTVDAALILGAATIIAATIATVGRSLSFVFVFGLTPGTSYIQSSSNAPMYACPRTSCQLEDNVASHAGVGMVCWIDGQPFDGIYQSKRWFEVVAQAGDTWVVGYVHSSYVAQQVDVKECVS